MFFCLFLCLFNVIYVQTGANQCKCMFCCTSIDDMYYYKEALGSVSIALHRVNQQATVFQLQLKLGCICSSFHRATGSCSNVKGRSRSTSTSPKTNTPQVLSTTFKAKGVQFGSDPLKDLKALTIEQGAQKGRVMVDKDWYILLECTQCLFLASQVLFGLVCLLHCLSAVCCTPTSLGTLLGNPMVVV